MSSDDRGVDMMLVAMFSVIKNNQDDNLRFYIVHTDISRENQSRINTLAKNFRNVEITFILADAKMFENVELTNETVSMPAYYRYVAPTFLLKEDRILYMDIDVMCLSSLYELYNTKLDGYYLGAVEDYFVSKTDDYPGFKNGIGFAKADKYANSGLQLMNLSLMRESGIMDVFWYNLRHKSEIIPAQFNVFADQTVMNITFKDKIKFLPSKYNVLTTAMKYTKQKDAAIVHFAGPDKPFTYRDRYSAVYDDIYYDLYRECMDIVGDHDNLMIKNTIRRLGTETTSAISKLSGAQQLARDKTNHVEELSKQLDLVSKEAEQLRGELRSIRGSVSWKITKPLRLLAHQKNRQK